MFNLESKVVVVTGGAGLLGETFCRAICSSGATVVLSEKDLSVAELARDRILKDFPSAKITAVALDITSEASIRKAVDFCIKHFDRIDALVNNAYPRNSNYGKDFFDVNYNDFCENIGLNLGGYFITSRIFAEYFTNQGWGNIINISSIYGVVAPKFEIYHDTQMTMPVEYSVIKSGLIHLTKYISKYLAGSNVRVNTLSPGGILDQQPREFINKYNSKCLTKGMLDKKDLTGSLLFLISDASLYVNGQNLIVDDGFTL